jgi:hypothetical protein
MIHGRNRRDAKIVGEAGELINLDNSSLTCVVFLHSFMDAQYMFGLDGFGDLYEWLEFTVANLLVNPSVGKILIKFHPNLTKEKKVFDQLVKSNLRRRFGVGARFTIISDDVPPMAFTKVERIIAITHHGSVAEELVYLGIPTIGSRYARWSNLFKFLIVWESPDEYAIHLREIEHISAEWNPDFRRENLILFLANYRLREWNRWSAQPWVSVLKVCGMNSDYSVENYPKGEQVLYQLKKTDDDFHRLIDMFLENETEAPGNSSAQIQ